MPLEYRKLAHVASDVEYAVMTAAEVVAEIEAEELIVVNLKGRMLTAAEVEEHLAGTLDGETVSR